MATAPHNSPRASNVAFIPAPRMPMKAKKDIPQAANVSFTSMSTAYAKGQINAN